jgi:TonB family protein
LGHTTFMFEGLLSKRVDTSKAALGASAAAHVVLGLVAWPAGQRLKVSTREPAQVVFFAPSRPLAGVGAIQASAAGARAESPLALPSGPGADVDTRARKGQGAGGPTNVPRSARRGALNGDGDDASTLVVYPFGEGMTRPELLSGREPQYTPEAFARGVEGTIIARCTIRKDGQVRNCRLVQGLEPMNDEVVKALESRRYAPVFYQGQPVDVDYVFRVRLVLNKEGGPLPADLRAKRQEGRVGGPRRG